MNLHALIMAGGKGTRFWPESTSKKPKQYLSLTGDKSLLGQTLDRLDGLVEIKNRYIVTVKEQESLIKDLKDLNYAKDGVIFEPSGRNTAPCILLSLAKLITQKVSEDDVVAILPSDHVILNHQGFKRTLEKAAHAALEHSSIVTIGINPTFPHTGYGYIEKGNKSKEDLFAVKHFREKPSFDKAKEYLQSGNFLWNAGMFVAPIKVLLKEFETYATKMYEFFPKLKDVIQNEAALKSVYDQMPSDSIDYAIMEKTKKAMVVPAEFDWNDLGSWDALEAVINKTDDNTVVCSNGFFQEGATGNIVFAPDKFVALLGVNDLIVVSNKNAVMIMPKSDSQKVKNVVEHLKKNEKFKELI